MENRNTFYFFALFALTAPFAAYGENLTIEGDLEVVATPTSTGKLTSESLTVNGDVYFTGRINPSQWYTSGEHSTAFGGANALGDYSTASGDGEAYSAYSTALGSGLASGLYSSALGDGDASGDYSTASGLGFASGLYSSALGSGRAEGDYSTAFGSAGVVGDYSTGWGSAYAAGDYSTAWGGANAAGNYSTAWGYYALATRDYSTAFGAYNISDLNSVNNGETSWVETDPLLEVGNGVDYAIRANALTILKDGRAAIGKHTSMAELQTQLETLQVQGPLVVQDYSGGFAAAPDGRPLDADGSPVDPTTGAIRYNSTTEDFQGYKNSTEGWVSLTSGGSGLAGSASTLVDGNSNTIVEVSTDGSAVTITPTSDSVPAMTVSSGGIVTLATAQGDISMGAFGVPAAQ